jgi:L-aspartate oxidase
VSSDRYDFDFLVIGSGIAGLFYALRVAEHGAVGLVTKKRSTDSATAWAQGGIAAVVAPDDSFEDHVQDTLSAGADLCHEDVVRHVIERGPRAIEALLKCGVDFDRNGGGEGASDEFDLGREGGHSKRRILHHRDFTGREIESTLLERAARHPNIRIFEDHCAVDLLTTHKAGRTEANRALGAYVLDSRTGEVLRFQAPITMLASGGAGKV